MRQSTQFYSNDPYSSLFAFSRRNFDFSEGFLENEASSSSSSVADAWHVLSGHRFSERFLIDSQWHVTSLSVSGGTSLGYPLSSFLQLDFLQLIAPESLPLCTAVANSSRGLLSYRKLLQVSFRSSTGRLLPTLCLLTPLYPKDLILVEAYFFTTDIYPIATCTQSKDRLLINSLHDYLISNLNVQLPSLRQLVSQFGTNEFFLKTEFRRYFGTSIYHFHREKRLALAYSLLPDKALSLGEIAVSCGFGSYNNFTKAFKKRFGLSPRDASFRVRSTT